MNKFLIAVVTCIALAGCKTDQGKDFIGVWKRTGGQSAETLTITQVNDGYRVEAKMENPEWEMFNLEAHLKPESDKLLARTDSKEKALELAGDGTLVSHLRNKEEKFTKVN